MSKNISAKALYKAAMGTISCTLTPFKKATSVEKKLKSLLISRMLLSIVAVDYNDSPLFPSKVGQQDEKIMYITACVAWLEVNLKPSLLQLLNRKENSTLKTYYNGLKQQLAKLGTDGWQGGGRKRRRRRRKQKGGAIFTVPVIIVLSIAGTLGMTALVTYRESVIESGRILIQNAQAAADRALRRQALNVTAIAGERDDQTTRDGQALEYHGQLQIANATVTAANTAAQALVRAAEIGGMTSMIVTTMEGQQKEVAASNSALSEARKALVILNQKIFNEKRACKGDNTVLAQLKITAEVEVNSKVARDLLKLKATCVEGVNDEYLEMLANAKALVVFQLTRLENANNATTILQLPGTTTTTVQTFGLLPPPGAPPGGVLQLPAPPGGGYKRKYRKRRRKTKRRRRKKRKTRRKRHRRTRRRR